MEKLILWYRKYGKQSALTIFTVNLKRILKLS